MTAPDHELDTRRRYIPDSPWFVVLAITLVALLIPMIAGRQTADFASALQPPSASNLLGTDHSGYDMLTRTAEGLRISLLIAVLCAVIACALGVVIGVASAAAGGWFDAVVMRVVDTVNALPHLVLGIVIAALWRGEPLAVVASISLTHWPSVARIVRAEILATADSGWVRTSRLAGASRWFVARRHLAPSVGGQILVALAMLIPHAIWHESTLSFLGVGLSPDRASLGTLLGQARGDVMLGAWWTLAVPATALVVTALAFTLGLSMLRRRLTPPGGSVW